MPKEQSHLSNQDLLLAADGEFPALRRREVESHLASCASCKARLREFENTLAEYIEAREISARRLPPGDNPRNLLKLRLAALAASSRPSAWQRLVPNRFQSISFALASVAVLVTGIGLLSLLVQNDAHQTAEYSEIRALPDPRITPGTTLPLTTTDVCAVDTVESARIVPASVAYEVFTAYGIQKPEPRAYEVDYLITPALGGSDSIRNFWPQPYRNTVWNAHIKDALEDYLRRQVCEGKLDLATAQQDLARDWIRAYQKYFRTEKPIPEHAAFLRDRPWE